MRVSLESVDDATCQFNEGVSIGGEGKELSVSGRLLAVSLREVTRM